MVQVIKRMKVNGVVHENVMSFTDNEWALLQKHYPSGGVSFEAVTGQTKPNIDVAGRYSDDDKPNMKDYNVLKDRAMEFFRAEDWDKALYYFELAYQLKSFGWISGKINQCKENAKKEEE